MNFTKKNGDLDLYKMISGLDYDIDKIKEFAKENDCDRYDFYQMVNKKVTVMIFDRKDDYERTDNEAKRKELIEIINKLYDLEENLNETYDEKFRWERPSKVTKIKKLKWCDNNLLSLMGIIELLEYAGYIPENSYKNCGEIAAKLFLKQDGTEISRKGFNNMKDDYKQTKADILGKIIDDLQKANTRILA